MSAWRLSRSCGRSATKGISKNISLAKTIAPGGSLRVWYTVARRVWEAVARAVSKIWLASDLVLSWAKTYQHPTNAEGTDRPAGRNLIQLLATPIHPSFTFFIKFE
jgi:hypothetical protein